MAPPLDNAARDLSLAADWQRPDTLPDLRRVDLIALDTETSDEGLRAGRGSAWPWHDGYVCGVSVAYRVEGSIRSHYFPIRHPDSDNFDRDAIIRWLKDHLASGGRKVTQNGGYDYGWLWADFGLRMPPAERLEEIGALATMVDENRYSYSLDNLCAWCDLPGKDEAGLRAAIEARLGIKPTKKKHPAQAFIAQLPARDVGLYAEADAVATLALFEALNPILDREGTRAAYRLEVDLLPMVQAMRMRGIRINSSAAQRGRDTLLQKRDAVLAELGDQLGRPIDMDDLNNHVWLAQHCDRFGITYPRTPTGKPSFTAGNVGWMHRHAHWFPQAVAKADKYNKAARDFLERHILGHAVNGRLYAEIWPHRGEDNGTKSFRFSYSDPPVQQMPSHDAEITPLVRSPFLPEEGERWVSLDQSQQEFRILTHEAAALDLTGAREAAERYRTDRDTDFHAYVAEITGLDRGIAKQANFGKAYGAGVRKFANTIGKTEAETQAIYDRYDHDLPFVRELATHCQRLAERQGYLELYDKARRHFDQWEAAFVPNRKGAGPCGVEEARRRRADPQHPWFGEKLRRAGAYFAMNALVQGTAARHTKLWMLACWRENLVPLLQMHDGLEFSLASPEPAERIAQLGRDAVSLLVPMQVDIKCGRNWADAKHAWADVPDAAPEIGPPVVYQPPPPVLTSQLVSLVAPRPQDFVQLDAFVNFVAERHAIYVRRQAGLPAPYTDDPILPCWRFTNMYRHLDKTSVAVWDKWILPHADDLHLWFATVVFRLVNHTEILDALGYPVPWSSEHFIEVMQSLPEGKRYGSAYVIPAFKGDSRPKYVSQAERIFTPMWDNRERLQPRPGMLVATFTQGLRAYPGMGEGFLAAQVAADTKRVEPLLSAPDVQTFALSGPGSLEGMNFLLGRKPDASWHKNDRDWYLRHVELRTIITPIYQERGLPVPDGQDLQNQECEYSKYASIRDGLKQRLKREYKPASEPKPPRAKKPKAVKPPRGKKPKPIEPPPEAETAGIPDFILADMAQRAANPAQSPHPQASAAPPPHASKPSRYPSHGERDAGQPLTFYIYRDARGRNYLGVQRTTTKQFPQSYWDGRQWRKGLPNGFLKIPYRLPEMLDAAPDAWVVIAAGEKDAETAAALGFVATTNSGGEGSGQWTPELNRWFSGKQRVAIMEDHDEAGEAHAIEVATALRGIVPDIRIVGFRELKAGGDLSDWIEADRSRGYAELLAWIEAAPGDNGVELDEWDAGELLSGADPEPRQWLIAGQFCRSFLSGLVAPGDAGKTTLRLTQAIELATGRELLGRRIYGRARVLIVSFEDDRPELHRRLKAICKHHGIDAAELKGWLFCRDLNGPKLAELDAKGRRRQIGKLDAMLRRAIERGKYDLVVLDPFVKLHGLNENDNPDMDFVCSLLIKIAQDHSIAVDSPAHTHKGAIAAGDADARRGASAQRDAGRLDYTLTTMTEAEAVQFGIPLDDRKSYVRLDKAKANIVRVMKATWFRLVNVPLGNVSALYPEGDEVQAIERWTPPETWAGIGPETLNAILDELEAGMASGQRYSKQNNVAERAAWRAVAKYCPNKAEAQCREIIKQWCDAGVLIEADYDDPKSRKTRRGLHVDSGKRPQY